MTIAIEDVVIIGCFTGIRQSPDITKGVIMRFDCVNSTRAKTKQGFEESYSQQLKEGNIIRLS